METNDIDITKYVTEKFKPYKRTIGRYNASEMWFLLNGKTTPTDFLHNRQRKTKEVITMWNGIAAHEQIQSVLDKNRCERKAEYKYNDITLVGKADYIPNGGEVWEFKTSKDFLEQAKPWHLHQAKLYCTMFEREKGIVFQPTQEEDRVILKNIGEVTRDDNWVQLEMAKLYRFHEEVLRVKD